MLVWLRIRKKKKVKEEYQRALYKQASHDRLTGLYTINHFAEKTEELMKQDPDRSYTFFHINIEKFSLINEIYGLEAGNAVLCGIADIVRVNEQHPGVFARLYADHFAICVPTEQVQLDGRYCVQYIEYEGQSIRVQMSLGVYEGAGRNLRALQALDYANLALAYREKSPYDHCYFYKDKYLEMTRFNLEITNCMEQALKEGQFELYLQPQFEVRTGHLVGAEALVRWNHPKMGNISPARFIPVLEGNCQITKLDAYMCEQICKFLAQWKEQGNLIPVSLNLSRIDLKNPDLIPMLSDTLKKYDIPTAYLHLEITESAYIDDMNQPVQMIQKLRSLGFCLEMDDFGSGYSSLNMLKDIPVDVLKLDMQFFRDGSNREKGCVIISSVVQMAHQLDIRVIAEGVETQQDGQFLKDINCGMVQGYLFGKPMPVPEFEKVLF